MWADKGSRSAVLQECKAVSMLERGTGFLWKAVLSHEWQQGDKGRLKVKQSIHREHYQEKACVSYHPFLSLGLHRKLCALVFENTVLQKLCVLCSWCILNALLWTRTVLTGVKQLITLLRIFPLRRKKKADVIPQGSFALLLHSYTVSQSNCLEQHPSPPLDWGTFWLLFLACAFCFM